MHLFLVHLVVLEEMVCLLGSFNLWVIQVVISTKAIVMDKAKYDHQLYLGLL